VANLAPISFFTAVGRKPPMVSLSMQPRSDGTLKDTLTNIRDTGEFATNLVTLPNAHHAHRSAFEFPPDVDEFDALGIEKAACEVIRAPRVASAPVAFECTLVSNTFTTPLDDGLTVAHTGRRMRRLDGLDDDFAAVDQASWSPSGSVT
jgi:flavin reductase (DIM6/NTAB) family NADH-FMN oxidoreductase RutF